VTGAFCFLPLIFPTSNAPETGYFKLSVLDVGHGHAAIVQTKNHTMSIIMDQVMKGVLILAVGLSGHFSCKTA